MKNERDLQNYLKRECGKNGISFDKVESRSRRGFPDCFLAKGGRVALVEVKSPAGTGTLSRLQVRAIDDLSRHGVMIWVVDSAVEVIAITDYFKGVDDADA